MAIYLDFYVSQAHRDRLSATHRQERTRSKWRPFDLAGSSAANDFALRRIALQEQWRPPRRTALWPLFGRRDNRPKRRLDDAIHQCAQISGLVRAKGRLEAGLCLSPSRLGR